jgi:hypothetical protein
LGSPWNLHPITIEGLNNWRRVILKFLLPYSHNFNWYISYLAICFLLALKGNCKLHADNVNFIGSEDHIWKSQQLSLRNLGQGSWGFSVWSITEIILKNIFVSNYAHAENPQLNSAKVYKYWAWRCLEKRI